MGFPLFAPSLPGRNYILFGQPISTKDLDPNDKEACDSLYKQTQSAVQVGMDDILRGEQNFVPRFKPKHALPSPPNGNSQSSRTFRVCRYFAISKLIRMNGAFDRERT